MKSRCCVHKLPAAKYVFLCLIYVFASSTLSRFIVMFCYIFLHAGPLPQGHGTTPGFGCQKEMLLECWRLYLISNDFKFHHSCSTHHRTMVYSILFLCIYDIELFRNLPWNVILHSCHRWRETNFVA